MAEDGYWRFCDTFEEIRVTSPTITTAPETERVVLEQHTDTGDYRVRPIQTVVDEAGREG
jgi:hypothetical protein